MDIDKYLIKTEGLHSDSKLLSLKKSLIGRARQRLAPTSSDKDLNRICSAILLIPLVKSDKTYVSIINRLLSMKH